MISLESYNKLGGPGPISNEEARINLAQQADGIGEISVMATLTRILIKQ